jgi:hypothetical protein
MSSINKYWLMHLEYVKLSKQNGGGGVFVLSWYQAIMHNCISKQWLKIQNAI